MIKCHSLTELLEHLADARETGQDIQSHDDPTQHIVGFDTGGEHYALPTAMVLFEPADTGGRERRAVVLDRLRLDEPGLRRTMIDLSLRPAFFTHCSIRP